MKMQHAGAPASQPTEYRTRARLDFVADARPAGTRAGDYPLQSPAGSVNPELGIDAFLAEARRRRDRHTREESGRPEPWADPDLEAIHSAALGHPVDRAIGRYRTDVGRERIACAIRRACERLAGAPPRSMSAEDVRAYPWHHLDVEAAIAYRERIYAMFTKITTRNDAICAVRAVSTECYKAGLISALRLDLVLDELYTVAPGPSSKRRRLRPEEIAALLDACERVGTPYVRARNTAIVALFRTSGMRVSELTAIELDDWDRDQDTILLRLTKNGGDHLVYLHPDTVPYLERWLQTRGDEPGALFTPFDGGDRRSLHPATVRHMLRFRAEAAGVAPFGSHDFRRTFATELLRTHDVALVGKLLNHNKTSSTLIYDLAGEDEQRAAVKTVRLPDLGAALPHGQAS